MFVCVYVEGVTIGLVETMSESDASEEYGTLRRGTYKLMKSYEDDKQTECHFVNRGSSLG